MGKISGIQRSACGVPPPTSLFSLLTSVLSRLTTVFLLSAGLGWAQSSIPDARAFPGWKPDGAPDIYTQADLYGYMDGGAELFFEFGFQDLTVQKYLKGQDELTLEAYRMGDAEGALGIYLIRAGKETAVKGVEGRSTGDRYQFSACRGNFFFQVNNFKGDVKRIPDMIRLMNVALATLAKDWPEPMDLLPKEHRVPGSFLVLRGPLALQRLFTFGEGDILQMKGRAMAYAADYEDPKLGNFTLILVAYPDSTTAGAAFEYFAGHLDSYLNLSQQTPARLVFKDAQEKYGEAVRDDSRLRLRIGLTQEPK